MGYDLMFLEPRSHSLSDRDILEYFKKRPFFSIQKRWLLSTKVYEAIYSNDNTGVYYVFDVGKEKLENPLDKSDRSLLARVGFKLNYCRPHIFGLEASIELESLVNLFGMNIFDPQTGIVNGSYDREAFLSAWNSGNEKFYNRYLQRNEVSSSEHILPTNLLEKHWRWNYESSIYQSQLGESVYVSRIRYILVGGELKSVASWTDGLSAILPDVDLYILLRKELVSSRYDRSQEYDIAIASPEQIADVLATFQICDGPVKYRHVQYEDTPPRIANWIRSLPTNEVPIRLLSPDSIMNSEYFHRFARE